MILGRQLKYFLLTKSNQLPPFTTNKDMADTWREVSEHREQALMKRSTKNQENLSTKVKEQSPLAVGEHVMIQNQVGNSPTGWNKRGFVVEVLPHQQYRVMVDSLLLTYLGHHSLRPTSLGQSQHQASAKLGHSNRGTVNTLTDPCQHAQSLAAMSRILVCLNPATSSHWSQPTCSDAPISTPYTRACPAQVLQVQQGHDNQVR